MKAKTYTGINIQFPISKLILDGLKTIETRTYPIPEHFIGQELLLVETPGKFGKFKSRGMAIITFGPSFKYKSKAHFYSDTNKHRVEPDSIWCYNSKLGKWGWPILSIKRLRHPTSINQRLGIKYTNDILI